MAGAPSSAAALSGARLWSILWGRKAVLVGQPSAGAVLTSIFARLPQGFEVQLPLSDYLTPKGVRLEKNPVKPDITVEGVPSRDEAQDAAVQAAIKALARK